MRCGRRRWESIPRTVAVSMAFEGEPVDLAWLEELHRRMGLPALRALRFESGSFTMGECRAQAKDSTLPSGCLMVMPAGGDHG